MALSGAATVRCRSQPGTGSPASSMELPSCGSETSRSPSSPRSSRSAAPGACLGSGTSQVRAFALFLFRGRVGLEGFYDKVAFVALLRCDPERRCGGLAIGGPELAPEPLRPDDCVDVEGRGWRARLLGSGSVSSPGSRSGKFLASQLPSPQLGEPSSAGASALSAESSTGAFGDGSPRSDAA